METAKSLLEKRSPKAKGEIIYPTVLKLLDNIEKDLSFNPSERRMSPVVLKTNSVLDQLPITQKP